MNGFGKENEMAGLKIKTELRPCYVYIKKNKKEKALFHGWSFESSVVEPSLMIGGHPGGTMACTMAIVELENGRVNVVAPASIQFLDNKFDEYCWDEKGE